MTLDEFATLARGVQGILTPLALLVAAVWTVYTFSALRQVARSRADQVKTEAEIQDLRLGLVKTEAEIQRFEREAKIGAVVEVSIKASQHAWSEDPDKTSVSAVVEIENRGNRSTRLEYGKNRRPFFVYSVNVKDDGSLNYEQPPAAYPVPVSKEPNTASPSTIIRAGGREKIPFYFQVRCPGIYLLVFTAPTSKEEQQVGEALGLKFPGNWVAMKYLVVERTNSNHSP